MSDSPWPKLIAALIILAVALVCYGYAYDAEKNTCESRGGHLERIIGGRGYVCEGATK